MQKCPTIAFWLRRSGLGPLAPAPVPPPPPETLLVLWWLEACAPPPSSSTGQITARRGGRGQLPGPGALWGCVWGVSSQEPQARAPSSRTPSQVGDPPSFSVQAGTEARVKASQRQCPSRPGTGKGQWTGVGSRQHGPRASSHTHTPPAPGAAPRAPVLTCVYPILSCHHLPVHLLCSHHGEGEGESEAGKAWA